MHDICFRSTPRKLLYYKMDFHNDNPTSEQEIFSNFSPSLLWIEIGRGNDEDQYRRNGKDKLLVDVLSVNTKVTTFLASKFQSRYRTKKHNCNLQYMFVCMNVKIMHGNNIFKIWYYLRKGMGCLLLLLLLVDDLSHKRSTIIINKGLGREDLAKFMRRKHGIYVGCIWVVDGFFFAWCLLSLEH